MLLTASESNVQLQHFSEPHFACMLLHSCLLDCKLMLKIKVNKIVLMLFSCLFPIFNAKLAAFRIIFNYHMLHFMSCFYFFSWPWNCVCLNKIMNTAFKEGGGLHLERSGLYYGTLVVSLQGPPTDIGVQTVVRWLATHHWTSWKLNPSRVSQQYS